MNICLSELLINAKKSDDRLIFQLIDPDKFKIETFQDCDAVDFYLVGGSIITKGSISETVKSVKILSGKHVYLFPGDSSQLTHEADGILLLTLISGRNSEYLIGQHVKSSFSIKKMNLDVVPTGYILVGNNKTAVHYVSGTDSIPNHKIDIVCATALAGEQLGLKLIYLEGGSGATELISTDVVASVRETIDLPIIVGGGIRTKEEIEAFFKAGATAIVVGNALENLSPSETVFLNSVKKLVK